MIDVLYVDDSELSIRLMEEAIAESGDPLCLHAALSWEVALDYLSGSSARTDSLRPDVVVLDYKLANEELTGLHVLQLLGNRLDLAGIPVVIFSNTNDPDIVEAAREAGATDYVQKPIEFDDLLEFAHDLYRMGRQSRRHSDTASSTSTTDYHLEAGERVAPETDAFERVDDS